MTPSLQASLRRAVMTAPVFDLHTHLFPPEFGDLCLSGADDLLDYHYLTAETLRCSQLPPMAYAALAMKRRAELAWDELFAKRSPLSEAASCVVAILQAVGGQAVPCHLEAVRKRL